MTKLEEVARALAPLAWAALGTGDTLASKSRRTTSLRHARAAVEAMRTPTEAMALAGKPTATWPVLTFVAMIDSILSEQPEEKA